MTNKEFGERVGCTHSMASRIRNGHRLPGVTLMGCISREFGISFTKLVSAYDKGPEAFGKLMRAEIFSKKRRVAA